MLGNGSQDNKYATINLLNPPELPTRDGCPKDESSTKNLWHQMKRRALLKINALAEGKLGPPQQYTPSYQ
jgi:hypothetical protein